MTGRTGSSPAPRWDPDELGLATATISATERYRATMRRLEQRVAACAAAYARDILPLPVAATA
jgi:hypothetical protein